MKVNIVSNKYTEYQRTSFFPAPRNKPISDQFFRRNWLQSNKL
jgi:hypothetical protein